MCWEFSIAKVGEYCQSGHLWAVVAVLHEKSLPCRTLLEDNIDVDLATIPRAQDSSNAYTHTHANYHTHREVNRPYKLECTTVLTVCNADQ